MKKFLLFLVLSLFIGLSGAQSVDSKLIEIDLERTEGFFSKSPVVIRAIALIYPSKPADGTALLWFRGWPGVAQLSDEGDWKLRGNLNFFFKSLNYVLDQGITFVVMDCPSDQWGLSGGNPLRCNDAYRASAQYADEVRKVMAKLRETNAVKKFFIIGHSYGSISSRWLAINLGKEIEGSIHSASVTNAFRGPFASQYGSSVSRMDMSKAAAPFIYLHSVDDLCTDTSYSVVKTWAGEKLITMSGGTPTGDVCGGRHYHSYAGIELEAAKAVVDWMRKVDSQAGN